MLFFEKIHKASHRLGCILGGIEAGKADVTFTIISEADTRRTRYVDFRETLVKQVP